MLLPRDYYEALAAAAGHGQCANVGHPQEVSMGSKCIIQSSNSGALGSRISVALRIMTAQDALVVA